MWSTQTIKLAGVPRTFDVYAQQATHSCGPSCVMMVINQMLNQKPAEAIVRLWFGQVELLHHRSGILDGKEADGRIFNFASDSHIDTIRDVLRDKKQVNARYSIGLANGITACSPAYPGVARLTWTLNDQGHFIVALGRMAGDYVYLDPFHGLIHVPHKKFPNYEANGSYGEINRIMVTNP